MWPGWLRPKNQNGSGSGNSEQHLINQIKDLQKELYRYQYNTGLLLIEKKERISAHHDSMTKANELADKLRILLGIERVCVHELQKALHETRSDFAKIKITADSKLEEAHALSSRCEQRSLEVVAKLRALDAKVDEVNRKTVELQKISYEIDTKESLLTNERRSFDSRKKDLIKWRLELEEREEKLNKDENLLHQRQQQASDRYKVYKIDLEEAQKKSIEDALKEKVEIQNLSDEKKVILDINNNDFEMKMEIRHKCKDG